MDENNRSPEGSPKSIGVSWILNITNTYFKSCISRSLNEILHLYLAISSDLFIMKQFNEQYQMHSIYVFVQEIFTEHLIYPRNERD